MPVKSLKSEQPNVWIPTNYNTYYRITILDDNGTLHTVSDTYGGSVDDNFVLTAKVSRSANDTLGSFSLTLSNDVGRFLNTFNGGELIKFYADQTDATTLVFVGRIDNIRYGVNAATGFTVEIDGRDKGILIDKTITDTHVASKGYEALAKVLYNNFSDITLRFWNGTEWCVATYVPATDSVTWSSTCTNARWSYDSVSDDISSESTSPISVCWDGSSWWVLDNSNDVYEYDADWTYQSVTHDLSGVFSTPRNVGFDGTHFWVMRGIVPNSYYKFDSSWNYTGVSVSGTNQYLIYDIVWNTDHWLILDGSYKIIRKFDSNFVDTGIYYPISASGMATPESLAKEGTDWWVLDSLGKVFKFNSNFLYVGDYFDLTDEDTNPKCIRMKDDIGYMVGDTNNAVFEYTDIPAASGVSLFPDGAVNMSYQHRKGWNVLTEVCKRVGVDSRLDYDESTGNWFFNTFLEGDIVNTDAGVSYGVNLIRLSDYGIENTEIANRIRVYGAQESDNIILLQTENDTDSQTNFWIKDKIVSASELTSMEEVQNKATYELTQSSDDSPSGRITSIGLSTIKPGDIITFVVLYCGIEGTHRVQSYTHNFNDSFTTDIELTKKIRSMKDIFKEKINPEDFTNPGSNLNDMTGSFTVFFDETVSKMSHSGTKEVSGFLQLEDGEVWGQATSSIITTDANVTECEFRRYENYAVADDVYEVTNDGGITWETYEADDGDTHTFTSVGNEIGFRMSLQRDATTDPTPAYESVCLLYK